MFVDGLKGVLTPWYMLLAVGGTFCIVMGFKATTGDLTQWQCGIGYWLALFALFVAHGFRTAFHMQKEVTYRWQEMLADVVDRIEDEQQTSK